MSGGVNLVLVGMMGSGKTAVGRLLAERLERAFVDLDEEIASAAGCPVVELFEREGENGFRAREAEAVAAVAARTGQVVATGGGVVLDPANIAALRASGAVVWLDVELDELARRVGDGASRPLLAGDPAERLAALAAERGPRYRAAAHHVVAAGGSPEKAAEAVLAWFLARPADVHRIAVPMPGAAYEVMVGAGLLERLPELLNLPERARRALLVSQPAVLERYGAVVRDGLETLGLSVAEALVPDGEAAKSVATRSALWRRCAGVPLARDDVVVALGGGVVGDLAGFAAATWNRGVAVVQLPTTLLAQVDSAVGGKTGINLEEGKNLVGAFHQPVAVVADTATLASLPVRELRSGLGEVVKYGFIADPGVLELVERHPERALAGEEETLTELVRRGVAVKARVVAADEREAGERALLNYGHTIGHAIETLTGYGTYRHGEAVALGMVAAARLAEVLGVAEPGLAGRTATALSGLGLPTGGLELDPERVWQVLARDKKARAGVRFVLCSEPGRPVLVDEPERGAVDEVLRSLA